MSEQVLLFKVRVGEHFLLQGVEYVRLEEKEEDGGIFCQNIKEGSSGLLSRDRQVTLIKS